LENLKHSTQLLDHPGRCIHIGDRESDICELFCAAQEIGTHFLIRTCVDRLAGDGDHTIADEMDEIAVKGLHRSKSDTATAIPTKPFLRSGFAIGSRTDVIEKLEWYGLRWKIEVFHKILKSGCKAEESKLRTAQRLANLISLFCILSWRVLWMTMLNRLGTQ